MKLSFPLLLCLALMPLADVQSQWQRQYPLEKLEDVLDIDISADGYGFAAGTNDLLMRMDPITRKWDLLLGFDEGWQFESVDYFDGSGGMIVAAAGQGLILSMDAGTNWTEITGGPTSIHTIKMFSPTHMIAISDEGAYEWKDGIWTDLEVPAVVGIKGGFILDEQRIWAFTFATGPAIYYTTDGGDTWNTNTDIEDIDVVTFFDAVNGIASDGRKIYNTTNGGVNWNLISNNAIHNTSNDITFGSSLNILMAATLNADPALSTDGGVTWTQLMTDLIYQRSYSVASFSDDEFVVGNDLSGMAYTTDRGITWVETLGPTRNVVQDIHFLTRSLGFAIGQKGMLLRTFDGGTNWEDISFGTRSHFTIHGLTANDLWIGTNQRILHSVDTGITWTEKLVIASSNFNDVLALSSQRILAAATSGVIYRSNDAGTTWDTVYNAGSQLRSIAQIDENTLMATGFNGIILRSADMGE